MTMLRLRSAKDPFLDTVVAGQAARLLALAEAVGLWEPSALVETLDRGVFADALRAIAEAGVARLAPLDFEAYAGKPAVDLAAWIATLRDDIAASPVPDAELPRLESIFGVEELAELSGVATSSLRRYLSQRRDVPDVVAARVHLLARIAGDLAGSFNERGVRRWFERPRPQLDGQAPRDILRGNWDPEDPGPEKVAALAAERVG
jgi:uncharacterized protein (DUF2384 family)